MEKLQWWLCSTFGKTFKEMGNSLAHGVQDNMFSCGIVAMNAIAHDLFSDPLWTPYQKALARTQWFHIMCDSHEEHVSTMENHLNLIHSSYFQESDKNEQERETSREEQSSRTSILSMASDEETKASPECSPAPSIESMIINTYGDQPSDESEIADLMIPKPSNPVDYEVAEMVHMDLNQDIGHGSLATEDCDTRSISVPAIEVKNAKSEPSQALKCKCEDNADDTNLDDTFICRMDDLDSNDDDSGNETERDDNGKKEETSMEKKPTKHDKQAPLGKARSTVAARAKNAQVKAGTFVVNPASLAEMKTKVLALDSGGEIDEKTACVVWHSLCSKPIKLQEPYKVAHFQ